MSYKDELQTKIINARDLAMQAALKEFRCSWCGNPVAQETAFCSPECLDADWKAYVEETLDPHQQQETWEE